MSGFVRFLALALLLGTALLGAGAAFHPMLGGDAGAQLRIISATSYWRPLHLVMLVGSGLVIVGIWVRLVGGPGGAVTTAPLIVGLTLVSLGLALNALNIAYMAGAGWRMATLFAAGQADMQSVFDATHPIGLVAARFGNFLVALGAATLGWVEWQERRHPRWLAYLAWLAAAGGLIGALFFDEASRAALGAVALLSAWEVATSLRALGLRRPLATQ